MKRFTLLFIFLPFLLFASVKIIDVKGTFLCNLSTVKITFLENSSLKKVTIFKQITSSNNSQINTKETEFLSVKKAPFFSKLINLMAVAIISILSLLSLSLYRNNNIRKKSNLLLKEKNYELEIAKENAEKAMQSRSEFLSTVSHELRTPLNAINGLTHLLISENPSENQLDYLKSLKFSGDYLLSFINDILEINRIESDKINIEQLSFNLKELLENIQNSLLEVAKEKNNSFVLYIDDKIPTFLINDTTKLSQIFINLLNNSLKFTKNGFVKVQANLDEIKDNEVYISFKVSDNGIGIPEDKQDEVFERFSQGSIEINRKFGGTGLGLAIVKKLIELLGGKISLNSKVGLGTTFSFTLPFKLGEKLEVAIKKNTATVLTNKKILLVEDNKINQMITKKMLQNKEMQCFIVDNGEDAVKLMKEENDFDLILMDVHLPGINGNIATKEIREFNSQIPIIALTAISLDENKEMLLSYGMTDVITKPFEPENLYRIIAEQTFTS